jgi:hypothetical protein
MMRKEHNRNAQKTWQILRKEQRPTMGERGLVLFVPPKPVGAGAGAPNVEGVDDPNPPLLL